MRSQIIYMYICIDMHAQLQSWAWQGSMILSLLELELNCKKLTTYLPLLDQEDHLGLPEETLHQLPSKSLY